MAGLSDSPGWFKLDKDEKNNVIENSFSEKYGNTPEFQAYDKESQAVIRKGYAKELHDAAYLSEHNPYNKAKAKEDVNALFRSPWAETANTIKHSFTSTFNRASLLDDTVGKPDADFAQDLADQFRDDASASKTTASKKISTDYAKFEKKLHDAPDRLGELSAIGGLVVDLLKNPHGVIDVGAESISSMVAPAVGGALAAEGAAAVLTAETAGLGAPTLVAAPFVGAAVGEYADAVTSKLGEIVHDELSKEGLLPTAFNIDNLIHKPGFMEAAQKKAAIYSSALAATDVALGGIGGKLATAPVRAAKRKALHSLDDAAKLAIKVEAEKSGQSISEITRRYVEHKAAVLHSQRSLATRFSHQMEGMAVETASEPASEAVATASSGDKNTMENLFYETIGGIGGSPVGSAINTGLFGTKLAATGTLNAVGKIKQAVKPKSEEQKQAKKILKNRADIIKEGEDAMQYADSSKPEKYDPLKAVTILAQDTDEDSYDKALSIHREYHSATEELTSELNNLADRIADPAVKTTKADNEKLLELEKVVKLRNGVLKESANIVTGLKEKLSNVHTKDVIQEDLTNKDFKKEVTDNDAADAITKSYGSAPDKGISNQQLSDIAVNESLGDKVKNAAKAILNLNAVREVINKRTDPKNSDMVKFDVFEGDINSEFAGVNSYLRAITSHLAGKREHSAIASKKRLEQFRDKHSKKLATSQAMYRAATEEGYTASTDAQQDYESRQAKNPSYYINEHSGKMIEYMEEEVAALDQAVATSEALMDMYADLDTGSVNVSPDDIIETSEDSPESTKKQKEGNDTTDIISSPSEVNTEGVDSKPEDTIEEPDHDKVISDGFADYRNITDFNKNAPNDLKKKVIAAIRVKGKKVSANTFKEYKNRKPKNATESTKKQKEGNDTNESIISSPEVNMEDPDSKPVTKPSPKSSTADETSIDQFEQQIDNGVFGDMEVTLANGEKQRINEALQELDVESTVCDDFINCMTKGK